MSGQALPRKLPLWRVLTGAFVLPWRYRRDLARNAGLPMLACIGWLIFWGYAALARTSPDGAFAFNLAFTLTFLLLSSWFALTVHRLVLLEQPGPTLRFDSAALGRLGRYFLAFFLVWILYHGARMILMSGAVAVLSSQHVAAGQARTEIPVSLTTIDHGASALAFVLIGRFMLLFPQIAIGGRFDLATIWNRTRGNAWRMAIVVGALPWLLDTGTSLLYRSAASDVEWCLLQALTVLALLFEVVALSLSHRELMAPAPPPTDPHA